MANYTKNDLDVKLLNENERVEYEYEFLKHDVHDNLEINKTVEGIEMMRKSQKSFGDMMSTRDEEAGEKYKITEKILMIMMMASVIAVIILIFVYILLQVYNIMRKKDEEGRISVVPFMMDFIFKITLTFMILLVILFLSWKGCFYIINYIKITRNFLHTV